MLGLGIFSATISGVGAFHGEAKEIV